MYSDVIKKWLLANEKDRGFIELMRLFNDRRDVYIKLALSRGETEYHKGAVSSLNWVCELPENILNESSGDTTETPQ
jgi:hypothetical protein